MLTVNLVRTWESKVDGYIKSIKEYKNPLSSQTLKVKREIQNFVNCSKRGLSEPLMKDEQIQARNYQMLEIHRDHIYSGKDLFKPRMIANIMGSSEKGNEKINAQGTVLKTNQDNEIIIRKVLVRNQYLLKHAIPIADEPCVKISDSTGCAICFGPLFKS